MRAQRFATQVGALRRRPRWLLPLPALALVAVASMALSCTDGAPESRVHAREHARAAARILREDTARYVDALDEATERFAPILAASAGDPHRLQTQLERLHQPPRGVVALITSPLNFLAAVGPDGHVISYNYPHDASRGTVDMAAISPAVRAALAGRTSHGLAEFPAATGPSTVSWVFAAPLRHEGRTLGALAFGIPLPAIARRLSRQLQLDAQGEEPPPIVWALLWHGDRILTAQTPPEIDENTPRPPVIRRRLRSAAHGYTDEVHIQYRWFGYAVLPLPSMGQDTGVVIIRSETR